MLTSREKWAQEGEQFWLIDISPGAMGCDEFSQMLIAAHRMPPPEQPRIVAHARRRLNGPRVLRPHTYVRVSSSALDQPITNSSGAGWTSKHRLPKPLVCDSVLASQQLHRECPWRLKIGVTKRECVFICIYTYRVWARCQPHVGPPGASS